MSNRFRIVGNAVGNVHQSLNTLYSSPLGKLLCLETELKNINPTSLWSQWAASQRQDLQRLEGTKDRSEEAIFHLHQAASHLSQGAANLSAASHSERG